MYEKHGLMSKISNPLVLAYLRGHDGSNTLLVENALRKKLGLPLAVRTPRHIGRNKKTDCRNAVPVKVTDPRLVDHLVSQRKLHGISHRYTIESAVLEAIVEEGK